VEEALRLIASRRYPLERIRTHEFQLEQADQALGVQGESTEPSAIHVTVVPCAEGVAPAGGNLSLRGPQGLKQPPSGTGDVKASFPLLRRRVLRPDPSNAGMWAIGAGHAVTHAYTAALYLLLPFIAKDLGLTYSQIGFLLAVRQFMSTVVNLPAGIIVDTLGRRNMFMGISLLGMAVPYLAISATSVFWVLALCMALLGIASFLWHPAAITSISEMYPASRGY